jgi:AbrB family looped-hinge helix DNA binding protein
MNYHNSIITKNEENIEENNVYEYRKVQAILGDVSFNIVLPKKYSNTLGIKKGDFVKVFLVDDKIIVKKA